MLSFRFQRLKNVGLLRFRGDLLSQHIDDLRSVLSISLGNSDPLIINLEKVSKIDDGCARTFRAMVARAKRLQKVFVVLQQRLSEGNRPLKKM